MSGKHLLKELYFLFQINQVNKFLDSMSTLFVAAYCDEIACDSF